MCPYPLTRQTLSTTAHAHACEGTRISASVSSSPSTTTRALAPLSAHNAHAFAQEASTASATRATRGLTADPARRASRAPSRTPRARQRAAPALRTAALQQGAAVAFAMLDSYLSLAAAQRVSQESLDPLFMIWFCRFHLRSQDPFTMTRHCGLTMRPSMHNTLPW